MGSFVKNTSQKPSETTLVLRTHIYSPTGQRWLHNETKSGAPVNLYIIFTLFENLSPQTYRALMRASSVFNGRVMLRLRGVNLETSAALTPSECLLPEPRTNTLFPFRRHHKLMTTESRWESRALNWSERSWRGKRLMIPTQPTHSGHFLKLAHVRLN